MPDFIYPPAPVFTDVQKLNPSPAFKKQVVKVITSIMLFFAVYLILIVAAVALAIVCCYLGIQLIIAMPKFITLIAGLGMVAVGGSVIFFLVKFIFAVSKNENPNRIEITEEEQPELFSFIRRLSEETKTPFPKKIFISPDVNACVFYNSSFWSMFFPVRKNLEIGLGLVNSINISELKAVIAHEFGHFSQRSMKLGSFTYNVNRIIYNMLYENNSYTSFLNGWGNLHGVLSLFALVTIKIAQGIQYILKQMYQLINKNYMGLSREMEFHADAVAASVAGGNNIISGLSRIELADNCYNTSLNKAGELLKQKKIMTNIFDNQLTVFRTLASKFELPVKQGLPQVSFDFISSFSKSRINYKNQWASHPELKERKEHLEALGINVPADETAAWEIFNNAKALQQQVTAKLYSNVGAAEQLEPVDANTFDELYKTETESYALPAAYKGYYDRRYIEPKDWDLESLAAAISHHDFDSLFTEEHAQLQSSINSNQADLETVKAIKDKQIDVKHFDFDGVKYTTDDCDKIIQQLEKEITAQQDALKLLDKEAYTFFSKYTGDLKQLYASFKVISEKYGTYANCANGLLNAMQPLYAGGLSVEQVYQHIGQLKDIHERHLKKQVSFLLEDNILNEHSDAELYKQVQDFMQKDYRYFFNDEFRNDELNCLSEITINIADAFNNYRFRQYKHMLEAQLKFYTEAVKSNAAIIA